MRKSTIWGGLRGGPQQLQLSCLLVLASLLPLASCGEDSGLVELGASYAALDSATEEQLHERYTQMLNSVCSSVSGQIPAISPKKSAAFLQAHRAVGQEDPKHDKNEAYMAAQSAAMAKATVILEGIRDFLESDEMDDALVKCSVLANATPENLAAYASAGRSRERLVERLLADPELMKQMLVAGGAKHQAYGEAMRIYTRIIAKFDKSHTGNLRRLALGVSLEHAVPKDEIKPVARYRHYQHAYLHGNLDPAFGSLTAWEYRFVTNSDKSNEELSWGRRMLRNYRPDHMFTQNPKQRRFRYGSIVLSDVPYRDRSDDGPVASTTGMQRALNQGGKCGPRAFFGRFITRSFGVPVWGARQPGHAAWTVWTPDGWKTVQGAHWRSNHWPEDKRCGLDFLLETQAREHPAEYVKAVRLQSVGDALGEEKVNGRQYGTGGGLWNALAFYQKLTIAAKGPPDEPATLEGHPDAPELTKAEILQGEETSKDDEQIIVKESGVIKIPAASTSSPTGDTQKILFMKSFGGGMQLHHRAAGGDPQAFEYTFSAPAGGEYLLTAEVSTVSEDEHLLVTANNGDAVVDMPVPYTVGKWEKTEVVQIELIEGQNTLTFSVQAGSGKHRGRMTIKSFTLKPVGLVRR